MLVHFEQTLCQVFGEEDTYRYGGDEFLCVVPFAEQKNLMERLERCRERLRTYEFNGRSIKLTCAIGYASGTPEDSKMFQDMVQLADIHAHKARNQGLDQTIGSPFTEARLRAGIVESNISAHERIHEINQLTGLPSIAFFVERCDNLLSKQPRPPVSRSWAS